jgi:RNA-directed DNA polymerase
MGMERRGCPIWLVFDEPTGNRMTSPNQAKPFNVSKREVFAAWKRVKANGGAGGIDGESLEKFEEKLSKNLYKLWNRMSSGSYFPQGVRRVEIPKKDGTSRPLGIPTVYDRVAQEVVRARLSERLEPIFHEDSYGYRPRKSAIDAVGVCRERNWKYDWVLDVDIRKFFDTIDHELLMKAVEKHSSEKWMILYVERWLKAPIHHADGRKEVVGKGTPQGGVVSPVLANLYLHYAFDMWMAREYPTTKFERFADDVTIHCESESESRELREALEQRLRKCGLELHPEKSKIVYCRDSSRKGDYPNTSYTFLGYTFQPRCAKRRRGGGRFTSFLPAASRDTQAGFRKRIRDKLSNQTHVSIEEVAKGINPVLRGWINYFKHYYRSELQGIVYWLERRLTQWIKRKYRKGRRDATRWLKRLRQNEPSFFAHWQLLSR